MRHISSTVEATVGRGMGGAAIPLTPKQMTHAPLDRRVVVPGHLSFGSLKLHRLPGDIVGFDYDVLLQAWIASGYPADFLYASHTGAIFAFIARGYVEHERANGTGNAELDELIGYLQCEDAAKARILAT